MLGMLSKNKLSDQDLERYSRQIVLRDIGYRGQLKLSNSKICVMGLGGLGCNSAIQLAGMGVGYLRLVERDVVEPSNLHRQYLYDADSIGYPKLEVAAQRLSKLNPELEMDLVPLSLNFENAEEIIKGVDLVIDGLDAIEPRYALNRACFKLGIPYIFGAALESYGVASTIIPGSTPCLECFYPELRDEQLPSCSTVGVSPPILSIISSIQVSEAVKIIIGEKPSLAGKLLYVDLRDLSFHQLNLSRRRDCPGCSVHPSQPPTKIKLIHELCGRGGRRTFMIAPGRDLDLSLEDLGKLLMEMKAKIRLRSKLGIRFDHPQGITSTMLKTGIMILEGASDENQAMEIYKQILSGMGIAFSELEN